MIFALSIDVFMGRWIVMLMIDRVDTLLAGWLIVDTLLAGWLT